MRTNRKTQAQVTRQEILDAAEEVFYETGLSGATLEAIAVRSGVTRGAIYWHFSNKADVFAAVFERTVSFYRQLLVDITQKATSLKELEDFTADLLHQIALEPQKQRALCILMLRHEWLSVENKILAASLESHESNLQLLVDFLRRMQGCGILHATASPRALADGYMFYVQGIILQFLRHPETVELAKDAKSHIRLFFQAFENHAPHESKGEL